MSDYSKQWTDLRDPEMKPDFDILEIAEHLDNDHYTQVICEGFGFVAVGKNSTGEIILAMPTGEGDAEGIDVEWKSYTEIIK